MNDQALNLPNVAVEKDGAVLLITINRPAARNALTPEMLCRLADAFVMLRDDAALRVAVITGTGDIAFCAGGDLGSTLPLLTGAREPADDWDRRVMNEPQVMAASSLRGFALDKPVIAAINGACLAAGFELMLGTDIRIAASHASFGLPEVQRGLIPFAGSMVRLPRQVPQALAMEIMLAGRPINAQRALQAGLVNEVLPPEQVLPRAMALAAQIAANGPLAVQQVKRTVMAASGASLGEGYAIEDDSRRTVFASADAQEGPRAFMEKRPPRFTGQ
ncbi:MAG: enoyl-CoA hydratase/isomerase family protein [Polaromonas sp.]|uniref:enoyl-CoA hydratase-related protein n=1 Tax=Polaromonas sp. TaxID=1869339 RepID=UPI0025DBBC19|nr:enoyl-CoA hydratase-related protein [Polaromonas sp.]MBI2726724.1 enoyl-CoA hydratase/isomerase family protein [Polaromonas sp.]